MAVVIGFVYLNIVNNFSEVNTETIAEMKEKIDKEILTR